MYRIIRVELMFSTAYSLVAFVHVLQTQSPAHMDQIVQSTAHGIHNPNHGSCYTPSVVGHHSDSHECCSDRKKKKNSLRILNRMWRLRGHLWKDFMVLLQIFSSEMQDKERLEGAGSSRCSGDSFKDFYPPGYVAPFSEISLIKKI